jgi:hypothetical protein
MSAHASCRVLPEEAVMNEATADLGETVLTGDHPNHLVNRNRVYQTPVNEGNKWVPAESQSEMLCEYRVYEERGLFVSPPRDKNNYLSKKV